MKFGLYARKSSEDSSKQVQSIENQIQVLKDKAQKEGLKISKIYQESKSAKQPYKREQFIKMIKDLQDGVIDGIITWKLDRLSRNPIDGGTIQHFLLEGIIQEIVTYEKTYYPNDNSIMMSVELGMATEYSQALSKNVKRGQSFKITKGHYPNTAPLGYLNTTHTKEKGERTIQLDPEKAPLIRKLWDLLLTGEYPSGEILKKAHAIGLKTRASKSKPARKLSRHGLYCIFTNPFYYGEFLWGGKLHQGKHQPLITKEEFNRAQDILTGKKSKPRLAKHQFALKGNIKCGECGASITGEQKNKQRKDGSLNQRTYYRCTHNKSKVECHQSSIREEELEEQIIELLDSITITEDFLQWAIKWLKGLNEESQVKYESIKIQQRNRIDQIDSEISKLVDLCLQDAIDANMLKSKKQVLIEERQAIEQDLNSSSKINDQRTDTAIQVFEFCKKAKSFFEAGDYETKRTIIQMLGSRLFLKDKRLSVELAFGLEFIQTSVSEKWIHSPRFATLKSKSEPGLTDSDHMLIVNGGRLVSAVLDSIT